MNTNWSRKQGFAGVFKLTGKPSDSAMRAPWTTFVRCIAETTCKVFLWIIEMDRGLFHVLYGTFLVSKRLQKRTSASGTTAKKWQHSQEWQKRTYLAIASLLYTQRQASNRLCAFPCPDIRYNQLFSVSHWRLGRPFEPNAGAVELVSAEKRRLYLRYAPIICSDFGAFLDEIWQHNLLEKPLTWLVHLDVANPGHKQSQTTATIHLFSSPWCIPLWLYA